MEEKIYDLDMHWEEYIQQMDAETKLQIGEIVNLFEDQEKEEYHDS